MAYAPGAVQSEEVAAVDEAAASSSRPSRAFAALDELQLPDDDSDNSGTEAEEYEEDDDFYDDDDYDDYEDDEEGGVTWYEYIRWYAAFYLDGPVVLSVMFGATLFALYGSDLRLAALTRAADAAFGAASLTCLVLFALELGVGTWAKAGYAYSFFWWLDILATASLVLDVPWIYDPMIQRARESDGVDADGASTATNSASAVRAARAARAGTRAGRIIRVLRLLRLVKFGRVLKLLKYYRTLLGWWALPRAQRLDTPRPVAPLLIAHEKQPTSSMAGQILSEQITKQTVAGVLLFIIVFPFLNVEAVNSRANYAQQAAADAVAIAAAGADAPTLDAVRARLLDFWHVLRLDAPGLAIFNEPRLAELRPGVETETVRVPAGGASAAGSAGSLDVVFDVSADSVLGAQYAIGFTSFIIVLLGAAVFVFNQVSNTYCIQPIESIMQMMRDFSANPLDKMRVGALGAAGKGGGKGGGARSKTKRKRARGSTQAETSQLLTSIGKIASLLQIGFGEAGAAIIGANLAQGGEINPMSAGRKMVGLFGFVVIFSFGDTTEALREGVMLYVNRVAAIVHACVHEFAGAINKNIGEAFLMVWPLEHRTEKRQRLERRRTSVGSVGSSAPHSPSRPSSPMKSPSRAPSRVHRGSTGSNASMHVRDRRGSGESRMSRAHTPSGVDRRGSGEARVSRAHTPSGFDRHASGRAHTPSGFGRHASGRAHSPSGVDRRGTGRAHSPSNRGRNFAAHAGAGGDSGRSGSPRPHDRRASGSVRDADPRASGASSGQGDGTDSRECSNRPSVHEAQSSSGVAESRFQSLDRRGSGTPLAGAIPEGSADARIGPPRAPLALLSEEPDAPVRPGFARAPSVARGVGAAHDGGSRGGTSDVSRRWSNNFALRHSSSGPDMLSLPYTPGLAPPIAHGHSSPSRDSTPWSSPPESPSRFGYRVDSRIGVPSSPGMRAEVIERFYVLPQGTQTFTTADCAVAGFALCVLLVKANRALQQLCRNEALQRLHPGFAVNTGYGLHMGWAIEGAIGSALKIDASYLSPNVNLASRLEAATKQYGVRILLSEQVVSVMSAKCKACLRKVDRVTVKGSARPLTLYTLDIAEDEDNQLVAAELDPTVLPSDEEAAEREDELQRQISTLHEIEDESELVAQDQLEAEKDALQELDQETQMFRRTTAIYEMRRTTTADFMDAWDAALRLYLAGQWGDAMPLFRRCSRMLPTDGPTQTLIGYLERRNCQAPAGWTGVRELTSK
ncbi:hypothetical protein KFE25_014230 [Diacronema lutheri]|uniref:Guanylate cyclase domain-containing protein n=2 Tax=Diacronema lutheri TaxID=2081491 RepID=A0A8J6C7T5_DIALT|nr:hypothetical protein KFE25_014230 [Diacronema lutheri]